MFDKIDPNQFNSFAAFLASLQEEHPDMTERDALHALLGICAESVTWEERSALLSQKLLETGIVVELRLGTDDVEKLRVREIAFNGASLRVFYTAFPRLLVLMVRMAVTTGGTEPTPSYDAFRQKLKDSQRVPLPDAMTLDNPLSHEYTAPMYCALLDMDEAAQQDPSAAPSADVMAKMMSDSLRSRLQ